MALGNDRLREDTTKSKTRSLTALGQSLRRGLTTRKTQKTTATGSGNACSSAESDRSIANNDDNGSSNNSNIGSIGRHFLRQRPSQQHMQQQQQQQEQQQHASGTKPIGYTPSPLSRGVLPASGMLTGSNMSLGLNAADAGGKHVSSIYGAARTQRIASASGNHISASTAAAHAGSAAAMSGPASRKTIYGSAALIGITKSGFNNSTPSLGSSTGTSEHQTIGRKGPPPPENHSASGSSQNRDYSFAIAGNINKSISNGSSNAASVHSIGSSVSNNNNNNNSNSNNSGAAATASNVVVYNAKSARSSAGAAVPITKEGYLSKKTDINPSTSLASALSRGWKVYRVVLKGAKLFFYKPPSESELRAMFPEEIAAATNETAGGYVRASFSAAAAAGYEDGGYTSSSGFPMSPGEVDSGSRAILFEPGVHDGEITAPLYERYVFGECFTEVDLRSLKFKRYVSVIIFDDTIVVLKRRW
ncbi:hypothetical protein GGI22_005811, partial [Coemansia erecta]